MEITSTRPTMRDVAQAAGVSTKTVSNVVTGAVAVREPTRLRVEAAMQELEFVPNLSARGLRSGRTGVIGLALADLATAFSASITHEVIKAAHARGLVVQLEETAYEQAREYDLAYRTRTHQIDGLILNPVRLQDSVVDQAEHLPPVVLIGEVEQHRTDRVFIDSRRAARDITEHLLSRGAQRIAVLGGTSAELPKKHATLSQRLQGHLEALADAGLSSAAELQADADWSIAGGAEAMRTVIARGVPFDAVLCFTDSLAMGAMYELHQHGMDVPDQVMVTGFDDVDLAAQLWPGLTTIGFDHSAYVEAALDLLVSRMQDRSLAPRAVAIPHRLEIRGSTARKSSTAESGVSASEAGPHER